MSIDSNALGIITVPCSMILTQTTRSQFDKKPKICDLFPSIAIKILVSKRIKIEFNLLP